MSWIAKRRQQCPYSRQAPDDVHRPLQNAKSTNYFDPFVELCWQLLAFFASALLKSVP
jgi:hypothetical protein